MIASTLRISAARTAALLAAAAGLLAAVPVAALQDPGEQEPIHGFAAPPAEKLLIGPGGVDLRTGRYAYEHTDLSIGGSGNAGLTLVRMMDTGVPAQDEPFHTYSHNWNIMITEKRVAIDKGDFVHGSGQDYRMGVHFGGRSETFDSYSYNSGFTQASMTSHATLTQIGALSSPDVKYTFQAADGTVAKFRRMGNGDCSASLRCAYVSEIRYPDNSRVVFGYDDPSPGTPNAVRLRSVVTSFGYALLFEYSGAAVVKACVLNLAFTAKPANNVCPANAEAVSTYTYTSGPSLELASVTDPAGKTWGFTYAGTGHVITMGYINPGETTPWLTNLTRWTASKDHTWTRVVDGQSFSTGESYSYEWHDNSWKTEGTVDELAGGIMRDALGNTVVAEYDFPRRPKSMDPLQSPWSMTQPNVGDGSTFYQMTSGPARITDALGRTTHFDYCNRLDAQNLPASDQYRCIVGMLQSYTDPEGIKTELYYGGRHVVETRRIAKSGSGLPTIVNKTLYDCAQMVTCSKPKTVTDANNNVTNYVNDPVHGGILSETLPAGPNGVRPQTRYEYVQRHAWISDGAGGWVQAVAGQPVTLLAATSTCRTSAATGNPAAPCAIAGDEVRTAYDYGPDSGPNTLLLRGQTVTAGGVTLRTCFGYDRGGRKISETSPNANLGSCP
jgi:hypothetical protein